MQAAVAAEPFDSPAHIFEVLWNGVRALAYVEQGSLRIQDRYGRDITHRYPELQAITVLARDGGLVLDGEITALTERGHPDFGRLYPRLSVDEPAEAARLAAERPVTFQAFDLLYRRYRAVMDYPLLHRKELLRKVVHRGPALAMPDFVSGEGIAFFEAARRHDLEGIVAKEWSSRYLPGQRSYAWLKVRAILRDEFVIGGFTYAGGRPLASLLLGLYDDQGALRYVGEVTGGFQDLVSGGGARILDKLTVRSCPFAAEPPLQRLVFWCRPSLAATVRFAGWSLTGVLRFPVFEHLRTDVPPESCTIADVKGGLT
jgi:bifunctional non-homologous end joining protein LigD